MNICLYQKASSIMSTKVVTSLIRRGYAVAAERVKGQPAASASVVKRAAVESPAATGEKTAEKEAVFWMRDPTSGNWVPETHFDDVDAADLRKQLLPNNCKKVF